MGCFPVFQYLRFYQIFRRPGNITELSCQSQIHTTLTKPLSNDPTFLIPIGFLHLNESQTIFFKALKTETFKTFPCSLQTEQTPRVVALKPAADQPPRSRIYPPHFPIPPGSRQRPGPLRDLRQSPDGRGNPRPVPARSPAPPLRARRGASRDRPLPEFFPGRHSELVQLVHAPYCSLRALATLLPVSRNKHSENFPTRRAYAGPNCGRFRVLKPLPAPAAGARRGRTRCWGAWPGPSRPAPARLAARTGGNSSGDGPAGAGTGATGTWFPSAPHRPSQWRCTLLAAVETCPFRKVLQRN